MTKPLTMHNHLHSLPTEKEIDGELRCQCRRLLAKMENGMLELQCPRCKRKIVLDIHALAEKGEMKTALQFV